MQSLRIEFIGKFNRLHKLAERGKEDFPEIICDYLVEDLDFHAAALFSITNDEEFLLIGKSNSARKSLSLQKKMSCSGCEFPVIGEKVKINFIDSCDIKITDFLYPEICLIFDVTYKNRFSLKLSKKNIFSQNDFDSLKLIADFISALLKVWLYSKGSAVYFSNKQLLDIINLSLSDIRKPLNKIIGTASLLKEDLVSEPQIEYLNIIKNNSQNLSAIFNDLLALIKIDSEKFVENKQFIELDKFIEDIYSLFNDKFDKSRVNFSIEKNNVIENDLYFDSKIVKTILSSIISLSFLLTKEGQVSVEFNSSNDNLFIKISDTGKGFNEETIKEIFEPLVLNKFLNDEQKSKIGLGLTHIKRIADLSNISLSLESRIDRGSIYTVIIPIAIDSQNRIDNNTTSSIKDKILVIEPDYATAKLISNYLNKSGFIPTITENAHQTLKVITQEKFLAIILDINLPDINGLELVSKIRDNNYTKNTPIIILTIEPDEQRAHLFGPIEYFIKPVRYNFLLEVLSGYKLKKDSNVLCVDDDIPTLNLVAQAIESAGFNPIAISDPMEVFNVIKEKEIELAIVDLQMPNKDGFQLIHEIKSNKKFENLPIIIYTGKELTDDDLKKVDGLFTELLKKSNVNFEQLVQNISDSINRIYNPITTVEDIKIKDTLKILIAEDYKHSQIIVTRLLKKNQYENLIVVDNGLEALELAQKEKFDLILMDMQMPVMNGFEATERIRQLPEYKDTPIIALTAFAMKGDREKCLLSGATDYIAKPIDSKDFIEKIRYYSSKD